MKKLNDLTPREMWDFIDGIYLEKELKLEELLTELELSHHDYLRLRKCNFPISTEVVERFFAKYGKG